LLVELAEACFGDMAALIAAGIGYGASFLGILIAMWLLNVKSWKRPSAVLLLCCMVLFVFSMWNIVYSGIFSLVQVHVGLVGGASQPPPIVAIISHVQSFVGIFAIFISDAMVCWRAWVLLYNDRFWKFTLALFMLGNIVINIVDAIFDIVLFDIEVDGTTVVLDWLAFAATLAVNLLATSLIGWKVWSHHQTLRAASKATNTPVQKILLLLVESGVFYLAVQMLPLVAELGGTFSISTPSFGIFRIVSTCLFSTVSSLYPVAVIILVKIDKSPVDETFHSQHQSVTSVSVEDNNNSS